MSNEYKDWLWDEYANVLLEDGIIDKHLLTIVCRDDSWDAEVTGVKDGIIVKYNVWFDENKGYWCYERSGAAC